MYVVSKGIVVHNGETFGLGAVLPDMTKKQSDRLLKLEVCRYVPDPKPTAPQGTAAASTPPAQPAPAGNAAAAPASNNAANTAGEAPGVEELNLNVNPAETIKAGA